MSNAQSKNDVAWEQLFEELRIIEKVERNGLFKINASQINKYREARLMTKFDFKSQLPKIFAANQLSILPISRGRYIIAKFETFYPFETKETEITKVEFPTYLESIDYNNITSESTALNCAFVSGIIADFLEDEELKPTVSGRMSSQSFDFKIKTKSGLIAIKVENAQVEIDGGYEGVDSLNLIEAKNSISKDFLIRQIYYPYRLWKDKVDKKVRSIFLTYTNGVFHFREYDFEDPLQYNSLKLVKEKKYVIRAEAVNLELIQQILEKVKSVEEPSVPFPQADSFERVINLCELLNEYEKLSRGQITQRYDFDIRQTNYYTDAGRYLGLIEKEKEEGDVVYFLSKKGANLFQVSLAKRQLKWIELILEHSVFSKVLDFYLQKAARPNKTEIVALMKASNLHNIDSESTYNRRSSTISSWVNWILEQVEE